MKKSRKIIAVCQDPGGSDAVSAVIKELLFRGEDVIVFASRHAPLILKRKGMRFTEVLPENFSRVDELFDREKPDMILAGTSGGYSLEDAFIEEARNRGIFSIAVLDSWVNYSIRFSDLSVNGEKLKFLPDVVCVMDEIAKKEMIVEGIPEDRIRVTGNPYFDQFFNKKSSISKEKRKKMLEKWGFSDNTRVLSFFSQTIHQTFGYSKDNPRYLGYTQFAALELLAEALIKISKYKDQISLMVRPHPKEERVFYQEFAKKVKDIPLAISDEEKMEEVLAVSDVIAGMFSNALVIAYAMGKKVISIQPNLARENPFILCRLGFIKTTSSLKDVICELEKNLSKGANTPVHSAFFKSGQATQNVIDVIDGIEPHVLRERIVSEN